MPVTELPLLVPSVPEGECFAGGWQAVFNFMGQSVTQFESSEFTIILTSASEPGPADRDKLWKPEGQPWVFQYLNGAWVVEHEEEPGSDVRRLYVGSLVDLQTYDGGSVDAVGDASGPMWEEDTTFQGRSPIGPGAIENSNPATTLNVGDTFGEGAHIQTVNEVGPHAHPLAADADITNTGGTIKIVSSGSGGPGLARGETAPEVTPLQVLTNTYTSTQERGNVVHPVKAAFLIMRTARIFRTP